MPYEIYKVRGGYKVGKEDKSEMKKGKKYASDKPLDLETAKAQMRALYASERNSEYRSFKFEQGYKVGRSDKQKLPTGRTYSTNKFLTQAEARKEIKKLREKYNN
jgi:hypothetical protein